MLDWPGGAAILAASLPRFPEALEESPLEAGLPAGCRPHVGNLRLSEQCCQYCSRKEWLHPDTSQNCGLMPVYRHNSDMVGI